MTAKDLTTKNPIAGLDLKNLETATDIEVVEQVRSGDRKAYSILVKRHQKALMRLSMRFVKDIDQAEDIVQESFIKAFEKLASFEARASFRSWLFQIAVNTSRNKLRDRHYKMSSQRWNKNGDDSEDVPLAVNAVVETNMIHESLAQTLQEHVEKLPFKQRTALTLRIYEDLSFKEIAEIMDCPYDTAKANYRHALLKLREDLKDKTDLETFAEHFSGVSGFFVDFNQTMKEVEA